MGIEEGFEDEPFFGKSVGELRDMFRDFRKVLRNYFNRNPEQIQQERVRESENFLSPEEQKQAGYFWFNEGYIPRDLCIKMVSDKCFKNSERISIFYY